MSEIKIGVYGIVKDEINFIKRCYNSIKEADAIVFCDTGSTDETYKTLLNIAKKHNQNSLYGELMLIKNIHVNPWRFDDARNVALYSLPSDINFCISIDADEVLEPNWYKLLKSEIEKDISNGERIDRYNHRFKTVWNWKTGGTEFSEHWHERIHARHGYRWKLPVHEVLVKLDGSKEEVKYLQGIQMVQYPDIFKPRSSYLQLLECSAQEDPTRWKTLSFLANEYSNQGRIDEAISTLERAINITDADKAFLSYQLATQYQAKGDLAAASRKILDACNFAPHVREYWYYLTLIHVIRGDNISAKSTINQAAMITQRTYGYEYNPAAWGEKFNDLILLLSN